MKFKEYSEAKHTEEITEAQLQNIEELSPVVSGVIIELQEFLWKCIKLLFVIIQFLVVNGIKTIWGAGKLLYKRYNKQGRADRKFNRQMKKTNKQIKKLRLAKNGYMNALARLDNMKDALDSMSKEEKIEHKKSVKDYQMKIANLQKQAGEALKKLQRVS